jgi:hypothetical protein
MSRFAWLATYVHPLMVAGMLGALVFAFIAWVKPFFPADWNPTYILVGCFLLAIEASIFNHLLEAKRSEEGDERRVTFVLEFIAIVLILRFARYIGQPLGHVVAEVQTWGDQPLKVFDLDYVVALVLGLMSWYFAAVVLTYMQRINLPGPDPNRAFKPPMVYLSTRFYAGGIVLIILTGAVGMLEPAYQARTFSSALLTANVLLYFALGLALLAQIQFITLEYRWQISGVEAPPVIAARWLRYSLALLAGACLLAVVVPNGRSSSLLSSMSGISVGEIRFWLPSLPAASLDAPLQNAAPSPDEDYVIPTPEPQEPRRPDTVRGILFWTGFVLLCIMTLAILMADRPEFIMSLRFRSARRIARALWQSLRNWVAGLLRAWGEHLETRLMVVEESEHPSRRLWRVFRMGALSPRERVMYYYLGALRRAEKLGFGRRTAETPYEYAQALGPRLQENRGDLDGLTDAFVEARYSPAPVDSDQADQAHTLGDRLRAALRALARASRITS